MATLLEKLQQAVNNNKINQPFTAKDLKDWINSAGVVNDDNGANYSDSYIESFLSSSTIGSTSTKTDKNLRKLKTTPESYTF